MEFLQDISLIINQHLTKEKQNKHWKPRFRQIAFPQIF